MNAAATAEALSDGERALADEIDNARRDRTTIPGKRDAIDLEAGYRIQRARFAEAEIVGRKIGMVSPAKLAQFGYSAPVHGPIRAGTIVEGDVVDLGAYVQPRLEPELVVVLAEDLPAGSSVGTAARAVTGLFLGVDILDTVWDGYGFQPPEAVADGVNGGGFLLGDHMLPVEASGDLRMYLDGELLGEGPVGALGDPVARLRWLATDVGGLCAGDAIFLGAPAANVDARPGTLELWGPGGSVLVAQLERGGAA